MVVKKKELKNQYVSLWLEGDMMVGVYDNVHIDLPIAKEIVQERIRIFGTEERLAIVELKGSVSFTKEARDYMGREEASVGIIKMAIIANSPITVTLVNFFLKITRPPTPTKMFRNKKEAIKWLMENV